MLRCGGVLSGGGAEVVLSEQFQLYEPWQRSEAVDEARPPRRVARFGGLRLRCDERFLPKLCWSWGLGDRVFAACWR
jgi:hypothetical protein